MADRFDSNSEEEVESFEVTDYDLLNEFNPDRKRYRQTKSDAIYGIWAPPRDDSDDEYGGGRAGLGGGRRKDFSAGLEFVSGGLKKTGEEMKQEMEEGNEEEAFEVPMEFKSTKKKPFKSQGGLGFKQKGSGKMHTSDKGFGSWEKHTKGIGQKLLLQMGYQPGKGLGKKGQGIITPVEAHLRKGKGAIGAHGPERPNQKPQVDSEDEEDEEFRNQLSQWKKGPEAKQKPKYSYKTIDELKEKVKLKKSSRPTDKAMTQVKVIDLTGKEKRVLSGYDQISQKHSRPGEETEPVTPVTLDQTAFTMPELMHNLDLLVDMSEQEIIKNDKQLHHEEDTIVNLKHEEEKLKGVLDNESKQISRMTEIMNMIAKYEERQEPDSMCPWELEDAEEFFKMLQDDFYEEYRLYELSNLIIPTVFPLMYEFFVCWDPLQDSIFGIDILKKWKDLIDNHDNAIAREGAQTMTMYDRMVWEVWMPYIRKAVQAWNPRNCDPLIEVIENWLPLLPLWVSNNIFDQLIFPKLQTEVQNWNPLTDTQRIDSWLHPWLPLMGQRLEPLYPPIRNKLGNALNNWHPSDISAKTILQPWKQVFSPGTMDAFLVRHIVPKLAVCLQEFVINPYQQQLDPFNWVMSWENMLPKSTLASLLAKQFFPKWLNVLCSWLTNNPNYDEVLKWYKGWKSMFSDELLAIPAIKDQINQALEIMNRSVTGNFHPGNMPPYMQRPDPVEAMQQDRPQRTESPVRRITVPTSFKDLVEKKAQENGILFAPANRRYNGKMLYNFGNHTMYIEHGVIFQQQGQKWTPVSLQSLIDTAQ
ncbi:tuftelin-interacting protein 11-like [Ptychodera flava]|uniref:tuftelin-interacting protein 11-like n=1 Tax=Ptychodera flava TaxID=63121 RepID=UPI003969C250